MGMVLLAQDFAEKHGLPGSTGRVMYFRGAAPFDSALDLLLKLGMSEAELIIFTGGSAGGLTVFLQLSSGVTSGAHENRSTAGRLTVSPTF